jgi:broad specificity phosphatase PhoE
VRKQIVAILTVLMIAMAAAAGAQPAAPTLVILVRHAEKAKLPAADPDLTAAGKARATALTSALESSGVDVIITTEFRRTRETAAPLAAARHIQPIVVQSSDDTAAHARAVAAEIAKHAGHTILVVGHSNTVPAIITALGGPSLPEICEDRFATLFVLSVAPPSAARLVTATYGAADPPSTACAGGMRQP